MSKFETIAVRTQLEKTSHKEHSTPLFLTSSFTFENAEEGAGLFAKEIEGNIYSRFSNPNVQEFADKISYLEKGEKTVPTATGMGAIFTVLAANVKQGDTIIASKSLFGNTLYILKQILPNWGVKTVFVDLTNEDQWEQALISANANWVIVETPSNPTLDMVDIEWLAELSHKNGAKLMVDNCFATPYLQNPLVLGADLVIHSATKWLDGQGRVLGGSITGSRELVQSSDDFIRRTGNSMSPFNAWVLSKSIETLAVRMDRHCDNAFQLAQFLSEHDQIQEVVYPHLPTHKQYELAQRQLKKGGGIVTAILKGDLKEKGSKFLNGLDLFSLTANLGDTRSIATHPASTTHSKLSPEDQAEVGIRPGLIRFSVGLENIEDIISDVNKSLNALPS